MGVAAGDTISCDNEECYGAAKDAMCKYYFCIPAFCGPVNCVLATCAKSCIEAPRRFRGP